MKSKPKHTAGKWLLVPENISAEWRIWDDREGLASKVIAFVPMRHRGKREAEANAKLVSAAPELLEALQMLISRIESETNSLAISGSIRAAKEAIKRATE